MAGSGFGTIFRVTTFGESHGAALGAVVDGCPAGLPLSEADIEPFMARRRPGQNALSTPRKEADEVRILSGVFDGKTTGTPICLLIYNTNARSGDYDHLRDVYRPGHADYCFAEKYGIRDHRGGGRSSGRETAASVAAGAVAQKLLRSLGIRCEAWLSAIGGLPIERVGAAPAGSSKETLSSGAANALPVSEGSPGASETAAGYSEEVEQLLASCRAAGDSVGSTVTLSVTGLPVGLGEPVFDKLDANLAKAIFSIGAVKGLDIGEGRNAALLRGSENNDAFRVKDGRVVKETNHSGGILGGMSDGGELRLTVYFKPTPSISRPQKTVTAGGEETELSVRGRHDPLIGPRAAVVVEAMAALVLADALLLGMSSRFSDVEGYYRSK